MIVTVNSPQSRQTFLAAAGEQPVTRAQMGMRLALFEALPGSGWQFYTSDAEAPLALTLRGDSATVAGGFEAEELGSFLAFLGVRQVTTAQSAPPHGYALAQTLFCYILGAGQALPVPPFTRNFEGREAEFTLDTMPSVAAVLPLLFGQGTRTEAFLFDVTVQGKAAQEQAMWQQYYADNTAARNNNMAEFWLLSHQNKAVFTVSASAVVEKIAYLSAGETLEAYRGQGIGGHYIVSMANEYAARGYEVCFVCEESRCRFYHRLGFQQGEELYRYTAISEDKTED